MAKIITTIVFDDQDEDAYDDVEISMGKLDTHDGNLVLRQGSDSIVVRAGAATEFAQALLKYVAADG